MVVPKRTVETKLVTTLKSPQRPLAPTTITFLLSASSSIFPLCYHPICIRTPPTATATTSSFSICTLNLYALHLHYLSRNDDWSSKISRLIELFSTSCLYHLLASLHDTNFYDLSFFSLFTLHGFSQLYRTSIIRLYHWGSFCSSLQLHSCPTPPTHDTHDIFAFCLLIILFFFTPISLYLAFQVNRRRT
jgi:hypothetical protein